MKFHRLLLFIAICCAISASSIYAQPALKLSHKSFTITGIKTNINVSGLKANQPKPLMYSLSVNGKIAKSGVALGNTLHKLSFKFRTSGDAKLVVKIGDQVGVSNIRCVSGWLSILPPLIAIVLALITGEVVTSLFIGIWLGASIIAGFNPFIGFLRSLDTYLLDALADPGHASIIIFSAGLGGMIGIINRTGGMQGIITLISSKVTGPRTAQLGTWLMGIFIFFDDYTNTLIVGNSMRPITDKNRISREKLSYLVDSTAAPVAGIAVLSTWIGYEIGLIRQAFVDLGIMESNFYGIFLQTIPFRFYCILALFFGLLISISGRDFGPMYDAEKRANDEGKPLADDAKPISSPETAMPELPEGMPTRWYNAAIPIAVVIFGTFIGLLGDGGMFNTHRDIQAARLTESKQYTQLVVKQVKTDIDLLITSSSTKNYIKSFIPDNVKFEDSSSEIAKLELKKLKVGDVFYAKLTPTTVDLATKLRAAFGDADSARVLIWVSMLGSIIAVFLGLSQGLIKVNEGVTAWANGVKSLIFAFCIMLLAWSINGICKELNTANFIVEMATGVVPYWLLPSIIFIIACFISFSTGTSWGTMAILLPISIPLAYHLNMQHYKEVIALTPNAPEMIIYLKGSILISIGAVLEGSIFGDHCSPISDTTIMSSMASGADHIHHVKTQAPYAIVVGLTAILLCYIPAGFGGSPYLLTAISMLVLVAFVFFFGKNPRKKVVS